jgi:murein tripeptide amidase MpaA
MASYYCVSCEYCKKPVPLIEYRTGAYHYDFPENFQAVHAERDPSVKCNSSAAYEGSQVRLWDIHAVMGFTPHPEFKLRETG